MGLGGGGWWGLGGKLPLMAKYVCKRADASHRNKRGAAFGIREKQIQGLVKTVTQY